MPNNSGNQDLREGLQGSLKVADAPDLRDGSKPRRTRKPSVARVIQRAGVEIAGCEINPRDGTVRVIAGSPVNSPVAPPTSGSDIEDTTPIDRSEWN